MRGTQIRLAALAALAAAALAGCGTARLTPPGTSGAAGATAAGSKADAGPPAGNRADALRLAREMLSQVRLPPGSRPHPGPPPPDLDSAIGAADGPEMVSIPKVWAAPASMDTTAAFLQTRLPTGMRATYQGQPGDASGYPQGELQDVSPRSLPAGIYQAELIYTVGPGGPGSSLVLVRANVTWYPRRSAAEHVPAGMRAVTVTATVLIPRPRTVTKTFTSPAVIGKLTRLLNSLPAAPHVVMLMRCPAPPATYRVAFAPAQGKRPVLIASDGGCLSDAVTARGKPQPILSDPGYRLMSDAFSLLGVKPW
jgi:hypothetical protein